MKKVFLIALLSAIVFFLACQKEEHASKGDTTDKITLDSLVASLNTVKAWDTTTITCSATGIDLIYAWECDHGNFNGGGTQIKYAAGECCVGTNTITCTVSNNTGQISRDIQIEVTSYFGGGK